MSIKKVILIGSGVRETYIAKRLFIDTNGQIKASGKKVSNGNLPSTASKIDLKRQLLMPGIVDMRVFITYYLIAWIGI